MKNFNLVHSLFIYLIALSFNNFGLTANAESQCSEFKGDESRFQACLEFTNTSPQFSYPNEFSNNGSQYIISQDPSCIGSSFDQNSQCYQEVDSDGNPIGKPVAINKNTVTSSSSAESNAAVDAALGECSSAYTWAKNTCNAQNYTPIIMALLPGFASTSTDDVAKACEKAADAGLMSAGITSAISGTCGLKIKSCETACAADAIIDAGGNAEQQKLADANLKQCKSYEMNMMMMVMSGMQALQSMAQAKGCEEKVSSDDELFKCMNDTEAMRDPEQCPQVACNPAQYPQNMEHQACINGEYGNLAALCQGANASYNPQCIQACQANPNHQFCANIDPSILNGENTYGINNPNFQSDGVNSTGLGTDGLEDPFADPEINVENPNYNTGALSKSGGSGGSGGLGGSSGGGGAPAGGGAAAAGPGGYDTDIIGGAKGGAAGGGGGGSFGGGYANAGNAWKKAGRASGTGKSNSMFDLTKLLKTNKQSSKRNPTAVANENLASMGISKANGLSNFQKVTRMINKKRTELIKEP